MDEINNISDEALESVAGGACPDKSNPYVMNMRFYNPTTHHEKKFSGSFPSMEAAKNHRNWLIDMYGKEGYEAKFTQIYNAFSN